MGIELYPQSTSLVPGWRCRPPRVQLEPCGVKFSAICADLRKVGTKMNYSATPCHKLTSYLFATRTGPLMEAGAPALLQGSALRNACVGLMEQFPDYRQPEVGRLPC
jgi:hypothetical protein